jgi:hypothetical protein
VVSSFESTTFTYCHDRSPFARGSICRRELCVSPVAQAGGTDALFLRGCQPVLTNFGDRTSPGDAVEASGPGMRSRFAQQATELRRSGCESKLRGPRFLLSGCPFGECEVLVVFKAQVETTATSPGGRSGRFGQGGENPLNVAQVTFHSLPPKGLPSKRGRRVTSSRRLSVHRTVARRIGDPGSCARGPE